MKYGPWTDDENALIRQHYANNGPLWMHLNVLPGRTQQAIGLQARKLGVRCSREALARATRGQGYLPDPKQIAAACAEIRADNLRAMRSCV